MPSWDILIPTIPHRHGKLLPLLGELDQQLWAFGAFTGNVHAYAQDVRVLVYRDNLQQPVAVKRQVLLEAASAAYVSFIDDDDMVAPDFVSRVCTALRNEPDYVGFPVEVRGHPVHRAEHSLRHGGWRNYPGLYARDITHLNPIRRELALLGRFDNGPDARKFEDIYWADAVRAAGLVRTEEWIDSVMYLYRFDPGDSYNTVRTPFQEDEVQPLPAYPWLRQTGPYANEDT